MSPRKEFCFQRPDHKWGDCDECRAREEENKRRAKEIRESPPAELYKPPEGFRCETIMAPAFDKRGQTPDYGIGCVRVSMVLIGPEAAVHFSFGTGIFLRETHDDWIFRPGQDIKTAKIVTRGMGYDVGYHDTRPHELDVRGQERERPPPIGRPGSPIEPRRPDRGLQRPREDGEPRDLRGRQDPGVHRDRREVPQVICDKQPVNQTP